MSIVGAPDGRRQFTLTLLQWQFAPDSLYLEDALAFLTHANDELTDTTEGA